MPPRPGGIRSKTDYFDQPGLCCVVCASIAVNVWIYCVAAQLDFRSMLNCPVALREFGSTVANRRNDGVSASAPVKLARKHQPVSRINTFDSTLVKYSRSARVHLARPAAQQLAAANAAFTPRTINQRNEVVKETYFQLPDAAGIQVSIDVSLRHHAGSARAVMK